MYPSTTTLWATPSTETTTTINTTIAHPGFEPTDDCFPNRGAVLHHSTRVLYHCKIDPILIPSISPQHELSEGNIDPFFNPDSPGE